MYNGIIRMRFVILYSFILRDIFN